MRPVRYAARMAIPIRTTITCPACGTSENTTFGDSSIGPKGRVSDTPIYSLLPKENWSVSGTGPEDTISCRCCGTRDFITLRDQARIRG